LAILGQNETYIFCLPSPHSCSKKIRSRATLRARIEMIINPGHPMSVTQRYFRE